MDRPFLPALLLASMAVVVGCGGSAENSEQTSTSVVDAVETTSPVVQNASGAVGETIDLGDTTLVVNKVTDPWVDPVMGGGEAGTRFVVADVTVGNLGEKSFTISGGCFELRDGDSRKHSWTIVGDNDPPGGTVDPGAEIRGDVGFQIPEESKLAELRYKPCMDSRSGGEATIRLGQKAAGAEKPTTTATAPKAQGGPVQEAAQKFGCGVVEMGSEPAPGIEEWGECDLDGSRVSIYIADDLDVFLASVEPYGVTRDQWAVAGRVVAVPDDQAKLGDIRKALA